VVAIIPKPRAPVTNKSINTESQIQSGGGACRSQHSTVVDVQPVGIDGSGS